MRISGVIEGFYGPPWTHNERLACIDFLGAQGMNTYVWAAKQEPRHRDEWNSPFTDEECTQFAELSTRHVGVQLSVALTPGSGATHVEVIDKLRPAVDAGATSLTLCVDDLPVLDAGAEHREIAHAVLDAFSLPVWVVPTHYAGTSSSPYLQSLCDGLSADVELMWTGVDVVNDVITAEHARARKAATRNRAPLLWDNTPVNDGLMREALHLGPFTGRDDELRDICSGILLNPMEFMVASLPTLESAAAWVRGDNSLEAWNCAVDRDGWRMLAEATAFPVDAHWPGTEPSDDWWERAARVTDPTGDERLEPWVNAIRVRAIAVRAAHEISRARERGASNREISKLFRPIVAWARRAVPPLVLGEGTRVRPMATQDEHGEFVFNERSFSTNAGIATPIIERHIGMHSGDSH